MYQAGALGTSSGGGGTGILTITGNTGGAVSADGANNINVVGDGTSIAISGNPGAHTLTASAIVKTIQVTLTSQQIKALDTVPVQIIPAPGVSKIINPYFATFKVVYGGTSLYMGGGNLEFSYWDGVNNYILSRTGSLTNALIGSFVGAPATTYSGVGIALGAILLVSQIENLPIVIDNIGGTPFSGNPANDNTLVISIQYAILTL